MDQIGKLAAAEVARLARLRGVRRPPWYAAEARRPLTTRPPRPHRR